MQGYFTGLSALEHLERKKKSKTSILTHEKENNNVNFVLNIKKYVEEAHILFLEK